MPKFGCEPVWKTGSNRESIRNKTEPRFGSHPVQGKTEVYIYQNEHILSVQSTPGAGIVQFDDATDESS